MNQEERKNPSKNPSDRPLYLHIQAVNQQDVKGMADILVKLNHKLIR